MMKAGATLVSILVPAYNAEATLAETLRSALASSYPNLELVLVDDGSTDSTARIGERFARNDARVRLFRQEHRGVSAALNHGIAQVHGDLVARLDADDLWHPTKLTKQVELLAADPDVALAYSFVRYVDDEGRIARDAAPQTMDGAALCQCFYEGIIGGGSSILLRRSALEAAGGYDERLPVWEDLLLHLRVAARGRIVFVPEYLTGYRLRNGSSSADLERSLAAWRLARKKIASEFPQIPRVVQSWSHARRLLELAEGFAFAKRYATCAMLLAECIAYDPARTSTFLAYRMHRRLSGKRRLLLRGGPLFADADVTTNYSLRGFDAGLEGSRLRKLDEARTQFLRSIDRNLGEGRAARAEAPAQFAPSVQSR